MKREAAPEKLDLRLPTELRVRLDERAKLEGRSRNAQMVCFVEEGLDGISAAEIARSIRRIERDIAKIQQAVDLLLHR